MQPTTPEPPRDRDVVVPLEELLDLAAAAERPPAGAEEPDPILH